MNSINKISGGLSEEHETRHGQQIATSPYTEANLLRHVNIQFHFDSCNKKLFRIARIWIPKILRDRAFLFFFTRGGRKNWPVQQDRQSLLARMRAREECAREEPVDAAHSAH